MSETDDGSNGFEILDEDSPMDFVPQPQVSSLSSPPLPVPVQVQSVVQTPVQVPPNQNIHNEPQKLDGGTDGVQASVNALPPLPLAGQQPEVIEQDIHNTPGAQGDGSEEMSPLNADMVWSGLHWGASFLSKVTEKAKNSVEKVITTLDPQMKPIIFSGGDLSVIVASDKKVKVMPVQDAFWDVFGRATVEGIKAQPSSMAAQPVGFTAGLKAAEDRILCLRQTAEVDDTQPVVAIEGFLAELSTDKWYDVSCVLLDDRVNGISLCVYTQSTPVDECWINQIKDDTPPDYPLSWCGFAKTIGEVASASLHCEMDEWHNKLTGLPRSAMIYNAAKTLAFMYREKVAEKVPPVISDGPQSIIQ